MRAAGGGSYTTLSPRQPVTATPYAIRAHTATTALALACDEGLCGLGLVAVQGSQPFWQHLGFALSQPAAASQASLAGYVEGAAYLWRSLP